MDIQAYISSGILESYVLGLANEAEKAEVQKLSEQYPEIRDEIRAIETSLENYAFAHEMTPPAGLDKQIWEKISAEKSNIIDFDSGEKIEISDYPKVESKGFFNNYIRFAASILLFASVIGNIYLLNKVDSTKKDLSLAVNENIQLQKDMKNQKAMMPQEVDLMMNPDVKMLKLVGQKASPNSTLMLAFDTKTNKIYLIRPNLPMPPKGKQYQLWAIMGDKPVDAGVFDMKMRMQELKSSPMPKAFAVTLENEGGSPTPTSDIFVMGI